MKPTCAICHKKRAIATLEINMTALGSKSKIDAVCKVDICRPCADPIAFFLDFALGEHTMFRDATDAEAEAAHETAELLRRLFPGNG